MNQISLIQTFKTYRTAYPGRDLPAGFAVFPVAMPLCLGIALASGAPLFSGLVAGIIGGLIVGTFSGSEISVSGPAAGLAVILAEAIAKVGSSEAFLVAVILAGVLQPGMLPQDRHAGIPETTLVP